MKVSSIGWCDYSGDIFNIVLRGKHDCECSPGCEHCYLLRIDNKFHFLPETTTYYPEKLKHWETVKLPQFSPKRGAPNRPMVFVVDGGDIFHPAVPADFIVSAFEVMAFRKDIDWVVLTKRPERMVSVLFGEVGTWYLGGGDYYNHIWLGVTAENQRRANERIPILLEHWAGPKFVSVEPMLERVGLFPYIPHWCIECHTWHSSMACWKDELNPRSVIENRLDWVICGAESGVNRRPFDKGGAENLFWQCYNAGIPFFGKQDSGLHPGTPLLINGKTVHEWPESR